MLWGHTVRSPHAHARVRLGRRVGGGSHAGRPRGAHARGRPRPEDVRARVPGSAGAGGRSRALLRRAGRGCGRGGARAGAPCRGGRPGRVRGARADRRSRARDRVRAAPSGPADDGPRLPRRPAAERRALDRHPARRSRRRRRRRGDGVRTRSASRTRRSSAPSPASRSRTGRGGIDIHVATQWLHVDRDQVAPCLDLPPDMVRIHLAGVGGAFGGREDLSIQIHAAMLALRTNRPVKMVYNREESFVGHIHRHPARIHAEHRATTGRAARLGADADPRRRRRLRVEHHGGHLERLRVRGRAVRRRERRDRGNRGLHEQPALRRDARLRRRCSRASPPRRRWTSSRPRSRSTRSSCGC